jgi:hypothetical protein
MTDLKALIERLEKAEVGSRELDGLIWMELVECDRAPFRYWAPVDENNGYGEPRPGALYYAPHCAQVFVTPEVSTSLDAALALAERLGLEPRAIIREAVKVEPWNRSADLARYACIAILKAKEPHHD